mmetsp:Transcript_78373/g.253498  ORF Transcript_78373/g.253498 Transcript_78373/m.253498 type:complete len:226 (-) Transcript_78373:1660-2337(-)
MQHKARVQFRELALSGLLPLHEPQRLPEHRKRELALVAAQPSQEGHRRARAFHQLGNPWCFVASQERQEHLLEETGAICPFHSYALQQDGHFWMGECSQARVQGVQAASPHGRSKLRLHIVDVLSNTSCTQPASDDRQNPQVSDLTDISALQVAIGGCDQQQQMQQTKLGVGQRLANETFVLLREELQASHGHGLIKHGHTQRISKATGKPPNFDIVARTIEQGL